MAKKKTFLFYPTDKNLEFLETEKIAGGVPFSVTIRMALEYYQQKLERERAELERWKRQGGGFNE